MKGFRRLAAKFIAIFLLAWLIMAQTCMKMRNSDTESAKTFQQKGIAFRTGSITVASNHHVHYVIAGNDSLPTLYFVHGSPGSWDAFEKYMSDSALLKRFRMIGIDRPGFGFSDFGQPEHLAMQSALISRLFARLDNHKKIFIAGHSLGGPLAVKLAADNPTLFSGLVIISGSIDPDEEEPERWRPVLFETPLTYFVPGAMRASNEELWYLKSDLRDLKFDFAKIICPVHFIHGVNDSWVPPANVKYGHRLLVNAPSIKQTMIPGANHFIPWTRFNEIKGVLLNL